MFKVIPALVAMLTLGAASFIGTGVTTPTKAAPQQSGLVNVALVDTTVQVPIAIAANVCNVDVSVIAAVFDTGPTDCDAGANSTVSAPTADSGGGSPNQQGLVNLYSEDLTIQLPIAVAANVCDVAVNVLARAFNAGATSCTADAGADGIVFPPA